MDGEHHRVRLVGRLIIPGDKDDYKSAIAVRHHEVIIIKFRRKLLIIWLIIFWRNIIKFVSIHSSASFWSSSSPWLSCVVALLLSVCDGLCRMCVRCSFTTHSRGCGWAELIRRWPCCRSVSRRRWRVVELLLSFGGRLFSAHVVIVARAKTK